MNSLSRRFAAFYLLLCSISLQLSAGGQTITRDLAQNTVTMADGCSNLVLRLNLEGKCALDQVVVRGRQVLATEAGVCSGVCVSNRWVTTRAAVPSLRVAIHRNVVTVSDIAYGMEGMRVRETWKFTVRSDDILWRIDREYLCGGVLDDSLFPGWDFQNMNTWTGGLLNHGGVAWNKYLETPNATFASHASTVTFWNRTARDCLRIAATPVAADGRRIDEKPFKGLPSSSPVSATPMNGGVNETASGGLSAPFVGGGRSGTPQVALRFSHQPAGSHTVAFSISSAELQPRHNLRRYHPSRQDLWAPCRVAPGVISAEFTLQATEYAQPANRGSFAGLNGGSICELLNTIGRYGVIDRRILGANGWRTGFACLHEQWFSQMGIALAEPDYLANCAATYDFERDHAIEPGGRVKSRWCHEAIDATPGTYDANGYYEAQWGMLLDSQPCFVMCVAELFDLTGDRAWLRGQKAACEQALDFMLRRDSDGDGLLEMVTDSHTQQRGSDWIDVIWAAHENALVNAEMYYALKLWSEAEELLGDSARAARYRSSAAALKTAFNKSTAEGGFWDARNQWYVYWREKDGSIHGNNLVTPVNFAAIGYGLCEDAARRRAILGRIESEMQKENLFCWPLCFFPFEPAEGHPLNFPFPKYENGDIFLAWGELAVRAYAQSDPAIAVKYIRKVLEKYEADGLSFQRYERRSQRGIGEDILANNCMPVVGLYRDIYGIQPKHDRLYLEPHLTADLDGTRLRYPLRGQTWSIELKTSGSCLAVRDFSWRSAGPFGANVRGNTAEFFAGAQTKPALSVTPAAHVPVHMETESWPTDYLASRRWVESSPKHGVTVRHVVSDLKPFARYKLTRNGDSLGVFHADAAGSIAFKSTLRFARAQRFELTAVQ